MVCAELKERMHVAPFRNCWLTVFSKNHDLNVKMDEIPSCMDKEVVQTGDEVLLSFTCSLKQVYCMREHYTFPDDALATTRADILTIAICPPLFNILTTCPVDAAFHDFDFTIPRRWNA